MSQLPACPECGSGYTYEDDNILACPDCAHEWSPNELEATNSDKVYRDANGNDVRRQSNVD